MSKPVTIPFRIELPAFTVSQEVRVFCNVHTHQMLDARWDDTREELKVKQCPYCESDAYAQGRKDS